MDLDGNFSSLRCHIHKERVMIILRVISSKLALFIVIYMDMDTGTNMCALSINMKMFIDKEMNEEEQVSASG